MKQRKISKKKYFLIFLSLIFCISNIFWILNDTRPYSYEDLVLVSKVDTLIYNTNTINEKINYLWSSDYPPFIPSLLFFLASVIGTNGKTLLLANILFFPFLILGIYKLSKELIHKNAGIKTTLFFLSFATINYLSRTMYDQFILMTFLVWNIYFLLKSKFFQIRSFSIWYAILFSVGMLSRYSILPFLIAPLVYFILIIIFRIIKNKKAQKTKFSNKDKTQFLNCILSLSLIFLIIAPWYIPNLHNIFSRYSLAQNLQTKNCYWYFFFFNLIGFLNLIICITLIFSNFFNKVKKIRLNKHFSINIFLIIISLLFFISFPKKNNQSLIPLLIPISMILGSLYFKSKNKIINYFIFIILILQCFVLTSPIKANSKLDQFIYQSKIVNPKLEQKNCFFFIGQSSWINGNLNIGHSSNLLVLDKKKYPINTLFNQIAQKNVSAKIYLFVHESYLHESHLMHFSNIFNKSNIVGSSITGLSSPEEVLFNKVSPSSSFKWIDDFNFLVFPIDLMYFNETLILDEINLNKLKIISQYLTNNNSQHKLIDSFNLTNEISKNKYEIGIFYKN
ncbi:hypothetical protein HN789_00735 [archaeon]|nr:hypothetical protein [Candidatus Woesearchaeota archaeon]MBT4022054.1 hypothetical protein [archaeon]MBT4272667.1 hypothetical protein [archaeon]MBT4461465.1 hypothetical protein [archaeon]MBT4857765.1 hypothetical protein [archaeon]